MIILLSAPVVSSGLSSQRTGHLYAPRRVLWENIWRTEGPNHAFHAITNVLLVGQTRGGTAMLTRSGLVNLVLRP